MKSFKFLLIPLLVAVLSLSGMAQSPWLQHRAIGLPNSADPSVVDIPTSGLQLWLRSNAGVDTLNGRVSRWHDQSGNGNDAIQTTASRQPLPVPGNLNGKPVIRFDGVDDKLGLTGSTPMTQFTLFMVVKNYAAVPGQDHSDHVMAFGAPTGDGYFVLFGGLNRISDRINIGGPAGAVRATAANIAAFGEWRIISIVTDKKIFNTTLRWNGSNAVMTPDGGTNIPISVPMGTGGGIGGADNSPFGYLLTAHCDFAETIVYNRIVADSERVAVENYLADKYNISITTGIEDSREVKIPKQFTLSQNYPNPFNPTTTISYSIPTSEFVTLKAYDVLGKEVAALVNEEKPAGSYKVEFNASNLSSGIYFYKLRVNNFTKTLKLVLIK